MSYQLGNTNWIFSLSSAFRLGKILCPTSGVSSILYSSSRVDTMLRYAIRRDNVISIMLREVYAMVGMLLVSRSGLLEEGAVEVFHYYDFHLSSSFLMYNLKPFQGK